jgi:hypothetical protein
MRFAIAVVGFFAAVAGNDSETSVIAIAFGRAATETTRQRITHLS